MEEHLVWSGGGLFEESHGRAFTFAPGNEVSSGRPHLRPVLVPENTVAAKIRDQGPEVLCHFPIRKQRAKRSPALLRLLNQRADIGDGLFQLVRSTLGRNERLLRRSRSLPRPFSPRRRFFWRSRRTDALVSFRFAEVEFKFAIVVSLKTSEFSFCAILLMFPTAS